ncbi:MAG: glycosyltransferase [Bacillati bacterium ANGP1]|uniref:Glycosyltransferase n=1 Tax=Candidatus Segetimicrobium genomatis TaxID=2569760 RepID=A0A537LAF7_9BACT|nr:MAG: glycosyltransferase [Terrabacteria group bacterium ANGP1]
MPLKSGPRSNVDGPPWATPPTEMERPRVAIIIVNWNGWRHTMECLESLRSVTYPDFKIFVVDNGSGRDDVLHLRNWQSGGTLIENDTNLGFSQRRHPACARQS